MINHVESAIKKYSAHPSIIKIKSNGDWGYFHVLSNLKSIYGGRNFQIKLQ